MSSNTLSNNPVVQTVGIIGGATLSTLALLALKYNDRTIFSEFPKDTPHSAGHPLIGELYNLISNVENLLEWNKSKFDLLDTMTFCNTVLGNGAQILTIDPKNVDHILKGNFKNYTKGPRFISSLHDLLGEGIFNANGENWRYQRKAASFIFNVKNFRDEFTDVFVKEMKTMDTHILRKAAENHQPVDFSKLMFQFTIDSFVHIGFGAQLHTLTADTPPPFVESFDHLQTLGFLRIANPLTPAKEFCRKVFTPWKKSTGDHINVINTFARNIIAKRRKEMEEGIQYKDLLSRFMNTTNQHGNELNDSELRDSILNFILAGRDTTAQALSWLFYNIMLQPRIEKKMLDEIKHKITDDLENDSQKLYEVISTMPYLHAVFYETLRLYPSVPGNQKCALEDDVWPDGTHVKAGQIVNWSPYSQGRATQIWGENAGDFYPERWIKEDGTLNRFSASEWSAFHHGPRVCLGQNLATLEALVTVIMLLRRYSFTLAPGQNVTYQISLTMPMKNGMKVFVEKR